MPAEKDYALVSHKCPTCGTEHPYYSAINTLAWPLTLPAVTVIKRQDEATATYNDGIVKVPEIKQKKGGE